MNLKCHLIMMISSNRPFFFFKSLWLCSLFKIDHKLLAPIDWGYDKTAEFPGALAEGGEGGDGCSELMPSATTLLPPPGQWSRTSAGSRAELSLSPSNHIMLKCKGWGCQDILLFLSSTTSPSAREWEADERQRHGEQESGAKSLYYYYYY